MKKITLTCLTIAGFFAAQAQSYQRCGIYFDYDATGNRVKRYYDCKMFDPLNPYPDAGTTTPAPQANARMASTTQDANATDAAQVTIYPNPANDFVNIRLSEPAEHVHFHFYDAKGSVVQSGDISGLEHRCNLGAMASGIYHLNILYKGKPYSFKIIKQ